MSQQEEMRLAIEEYLGWKRGHWQEWASTGSITVRNGRIWSQSKATSPDGKICDRTPDFCGSLDAMREAIGVLNSSREFQPCHEFVVVLRGIVHPWRTMSEESLCWYLLNSTAAEQAEAFCRTLKIGPFKESLSGGPNEVTTPKPEPAESISGAPSVTHTRGGESAESPAAS